MLKKVIFACLFILSTNTFAGAFVEIPVSIDTDENGNPVMATGSFTSARYSDNDVESIGCGIRRFEGGGGWGFCQARDATGLYLGCATYDLSMMESLSAASDNSFIFFFTRAFDPETSEEADFAWRGFTSMCTFVQVSTQSQYIFDSKSTKK